MGRLAESVTMPVIPTTTYSTLAKPDLGGGASICLYHPDLACPFGLQPPAIPMFLHALGASSVRFLSYTLQACHSPPSRCSRACDTEVHALSYCRRNHAEDAEPEYRFIQLSPRPRTNHLIATRRGLVFCLLVALHRSVTLTTRHESMANLESRRLAKTLA